MNKKLIYNDILTDIEKNNFTDMAIELKGLTGDVLWLHGGLIKKTVSVVGSDGEKKFGKPAGKYLTLECADFYENDETKARLCQTLSDCIFELIEFLGATVKKILVVGVGNIMMTADALGPDTVNKIRPILIEQNPSEKTTHNLNPADDKKSANEPPNNIRPTLIEQNPSEKTTHNLNPADDKNGKKNHNGEPVRLCTIIPNVVGMTGIESFDLVCAAAEKTKPDLIIAVDTLAAGNTARLKNTFQLSTAGLQPGGGVKNHRPALTRENLGVPVVAIGVPLVVRASNLAADILESYGKTIYFKTTNATDRSEQKAAIKTSRISDMIVTVKDVDAAVAECSDVISFAINSIQNCSNRVFQ
jgi:spore protease